MTLITKRGAITHLSQSTTTIGRNGNVNSMESYSFRINGTPALAQVSANMGLNENDEVIAVGKMKNGSLKVLAIKNETTGALTPASGTIGLIMGLCFVFLGFLTIVFLVGFALLPVGFYMVYQSRQASKANYILRSL